MNTINSFIGSTFISHATFLTSVFLLSRRRQPHEEVGKEEKKKDDLTVIYHCLWQSGFQATLEQKGKFEGKFMSCPPW